MWNDGSLEFYRRSARELTELIEGAADRIIWRTSFRLFEILHRQHPEIAKRNPYLSEYQRFVIPLVAVTTQKLLNRSLIPQIVSLGERYEEGEEHPVLYSDATQSWKSVKTGLFIELCLFELLSSWKSFSEALVLLRRELREGKLMEREIQYWELYTPSMLSYYRIPRDDGSDARVEPRVLVAH